MECTLAALIACFSWSGLFVDTGIAYQDHGEQWRYGIYEDGQMTRVVSADWKRNPYGRFGIGYEVSVGRFTWTLEARHVSSLAEGDDKGVNSISLGARWFPFR